MSQLMQYRFRLFGPRKGKTMSVNGHRFVNGEAVLVQQSDAMGACQRVLGFYGAFARGTLEYDAAMAKEEAEDGGSEVHAKSQSGSAVPVHNGVQPNGAEPTQESASAGDGDVKGQNGGTGAGSAGSGHEDAGVPKFEESADRPEPTEPSSVANEDIAAAVKQLSPSEDSHWVATGAHAGKPKLAAVEQAYGKAGLTRQDVEAALPGWTRDRAVEVALEA